MKRDNLRNQIEEFYLPQQLVEAILDVGGIPRESEEAELGIGFIDIADYTFLSKFLTPKENQEVLNGLYTAFSGVLKRHGGYLNKTEGDSLMFHYGGLIDPVARTSTDSESVRLYIARELFLTCVEMQRVSLRFNEADERFLDQYAGDTDREVLERAFAIIKRMRNDSTVADSLSAMFQIRIRVGASLGEVTNGNFGPPGARQWDVIGMPVIDAKRMETTAPVGGLRISRNYYELLKTQGFLDEYFERFRREAGALGSRYAKITWDELFAMRRVRIREKGNAYYETCSIQVNPGLPEQVARQVVALLAYGKFGADRILQTVQYYRGNRYVIDAIEETLTDHGVHLRRTDAYEVMYPKRFAHLLETFGHDRQAVEQQLTQEMSLYDVLTKVGRYQDIINDSTPMDDEPLPFSSYDEHVALLKQRYSFRYERLKAEIAQRAFFHNVVFPMVFSSFLAAILEYQAEQENLELLSS